MTGDKCNGMYIPVLNKTSTNCKGQSRLLVVKFKAVKQQDYFIANYHIISKFKFDKLPCTNLLIERDYKI